MLRTAPATRFRRMLARFTRCSSDSTRIRAHSLLLSRLVALRASRDHGSTQPGELGRLQARPQTPSKPPQGHKQPQARVLLVCEMCYYNTSRLSLGKLVKSSHRQGGMGRTALRHRCEPTVQSLHVYSAASDHWLSSIEIPEDGMHAPGFIERHHRVGGAWVAQPAVGPVAQRVLRGVRRARRAPSPAVAAAGSADGGPRAR